MSSMLARLLLTIGGSEGIGSLRDNDCAFPTVFANEMVVTLRPSKQWQWLGEHRAAGTPEHECRGVRRIIIAR